MQTSEDATTSPLNRISQSLDLEIIPKTHSLRDLVQQKASENTEDPFYIIDLACIEKKYHQWKALLPRVEPFYAMKCNPDEPIIKLLSYLGTGFDCASQVEIDKALKLGTHPNNIIFANPCKSKAHITHSKNQDVRMMTFDNAEELHKIHQIFPNAEVVLRILTDDSKSVCRFGTKFGASFLESLKLISLCSKLNLNLIGVSFHVGSGCYSVEAFVNAVERAYKIFEIAERVGYNLRLLDIGGGWPGVDEPSKPSFADIANAIRPRIDTLFPPHVRIIAEPGRYFVSESHTLVLNVISKREMRTAPADAKDFEANIESIDITEEESNPHDPSKQYKYYVNDGVYASFNCIIFDHAHIYPKLVRDIDPEEPTFFCEMFGPTCDSIDLIVKGISFPKLEVGEYIYFEEMGAYTRAAGGSEFNGFPLPKIYYVWGERHLEQHSLRVESQVVDALPTLIEEEEQKYEHEGVKEVATDFRRSTARGITLNVSGRRGSSTENKKRHPNSVTRSQTTLEARRASIESSITMVKKLKIEDS